MEAVSWGWKLECFAPSTRWRSGPGTDRGPAKMEAVSPGEVEVWGMMQVKCLHN